MQAHATTLDKQIDTFERLLSKSHQPEMINENFNKCFNGKDTKDIIISAATNGKIKVVQYLLDNKLADANATWDEKVTPLFMAVYNGHTEVVKLLLSRGANPFSPEYKNDVTPLYAAAMNGHTECVDALLEHSSASKKLRKSLRAALQIANEKTHTEISKLIQKKLKQIEQAEEKKAAPPTPPTFPTPSPQSDSTDRKLYDDENHNPIDLNKLLFKAVEDGELDEVKSLLRVGADVNCVEFKTGDTPLHRAVQMDAIYIARELLNAGADPEAENKRRDTPIYLSKQRDEEDDDDDSFSLTDEMNEKIKEKKIEQEKKLSQLPSSSASSSSSARPVTVPTQSSSMAPLGQNNRFMDTLAIAYNIAKKSGQNNMVTFIERTMKEESSLTQPPSSSSSSSVPSPARSNREEQKEGKSISGMPPTPKQDKRKLKIMIVENDLEMSEPLKNHLEKFGYDVVIANNIATAVQNFKSDKGIDMIFMDKEICDVGTTEKSISKLITKIRAEESVGPDCKPITIAGFAYSTHSPINPGDDMTLQAAYQIKRFIDDFDDELDELVSNRKQSGKGMS